MSTEQEIQQDGTALVERSSAITVTDSASYEMAAEFLKLLKGYRKRVADMFGTLVKAAHTAWKEAVATRKRFDQPANEAEYTVKNRMIAWRQEEQEKVRREQAAREAELRRKAEEARIAEAEAIQAAGDAQQAEAILDQPIQVAPVAPRPVAPKISGVSIRKKWSFRITDPNAVPRKYLSIDEKKIGAEVRAFKGETIIAGVEVFQEELIGAGSA